ncbi:MAG: hypothetical protein P4L62_00485 [Candidatus Pacebacteria bacterium]|nr:hypothetical protein [Candidatus Paceibacterota bacterium]MDR3582826.1 hypothetical protein [Candidatus Paceibacterota bacterium]
MKRNILFAVSIVPVLLFVIPTANSTTINSWTKKEALSLPVKVAETAPYPEIKLSETATIRLGFRGSESRFDVKIISTDSSGPFDIKDRAIYLGWCAARSLQIEKNTPISGVRLFSSDDPTAIPSWDRRVNWNVINYILNHKSGATPDEIQARVWALTDPTFPQSKLDKKSRVFLVRAERDGKNFHPVPGEKVAILCDTGFHRQLIFFELTIPRPVELSPPAIAAPLPAVPVSYVAWWPVPIIVPIIPGGGSNQPTPPPPGSVSEPSSLLLVLAGIIPFALARRKRGF